MDQIGTIELAGSTYLYALALIAIAFVGFSSIAAVIRQTLGAGLSKLQVLLTRNYIEHGSLIAGLSLLPMFLNLFDLPYIVVWRISSTIAGIVLSLSIAFFPLRYRKASSTPLPLLAWIHLLMAAAVILGMFANAAGILAEPKVGLYALALTFLLVEAVDTFLHSLNSFLLQPKEGSAANENIKL